MTRSSISKLSNGWLLFPGLALLACSAPIDTGSQQTEETAEAIVYGTSVTTDKIGTPWLQMWTAPNGGTQTGYCTGTMLSDHWVLTARHCVNGNSQSCGAAIAGSQVSAVMGANHEGLTVWGDKLYTHPDCNVDIALVHLTGSSLLNPTGDPWGTPLYLGASSGLVGQQFYVQGFGYNIPTSSDGKLRSAWLTISSSGFWSSPNSQGQYPSEGDSGAPALVWYNGHPNIIGVFSQYQGTSSYFVGVEQFRDWVQAWTGNAIVVFKDQECTGATQQLLPGGPTLGRYDYEQLTGPGLIGNDTISSLMVPKGGPSVSLYDNWRFDTLLETRGGGFWDVSAADNERTSSAIVQNSGVMLYTGQNFTGSLLTKTSTAGSIYRTSFDNKIRSLKVPAGWNVSLFDDPDCWSSTGYTYYEGQYGVLNSAIDSKASCLYIREPAAAYVAKNYGSTVSKLLPGAYDMAQLGIPNDSMMSLFVPAGSAVVQLIWDAGFSGNSRFFASSVADLSTVGWGVQASGARVYAWPSGCGVLRAGEGIFRPSIGVASAIESCSERYYLRVQSDGNLTLFDTIKGYNIWWALTYVSDGQVAVMQDDGNFILRTSAGGGVLWTSNTSGNSGAYLTVDDDGHVRVRNSAGTSLATWP